MKTFLLTLAFATLLPSAQAATEYVYGRGSSFGYCDGTFFSSCSNTISNSAEQSGRQDAVMQCQLKGGQMPGYQAYCSTSCNPNWLPYDAPQTYVTCQATCNGSCEIPDRP